MLDITAIVTRGSDLIFAGNIVHRTHNVAYKRGLLIASNAVLYLMVLGRSA